MRVLVVHAHPVAASFNASLFRMTVERLRKNGHEVDAIDLYADGFNPVMSEAERLNYHDLETNRKPVEDYVRRLLNAGADKVSFNSAAVAEPQVIRDASDKYGAQCIVVAIDAKRRRDAQGQPVAGWDVYTHGGRKNTGLDAVAWAARMAELGAGEILLTSMDRDGTKSGFDLELTRAVADAVPVPVIASGGVGSLQHLADGIRLGGADAVLAASIFHYGEFTVGQAKALMARDGIPVRL